MSADWVIVETFWSVEEAQLARGFLETEGVECHLEDLATATNFWHLSIATGGVKLRVAPSDADRAVALLQSVEHGHPDADEIASDTTPEFINSTASTAGSAEFIDTDFEGDQFESEVDLGRHAGLFDKFRNSKLLVILVYLVALISGGI